MSGAEDTIERCAAPRGVIRAALSIVLAVAGFAAPTRAHVIFDRTTLRQQAEGAASVAVVELETGLVTWSAPDGSDHQEYLRARTISVLKGEALPATIELFPHAEGEPRWQAGERAIVFLDRTAQRAEFLSLAARFPWFTVQGAGQEWVLDATGEGEVTASVRAWIDLAAHAVDADATARLRETLLRQLRARDERLRRDAISELVRARQRPDLFAAPKDVAPFAKLCAPGRLAPSERVALALLLDGAPGFDTNARLRAMTREPLSPPDRLVLARASALRGDAALRAWLEALRDDPDLGLRSEVEAALARAPQASPSP